MEKSGKRLDTLEVLKFENWLVHSRVITDKTSSQQWTSTVIAELGERSRSLCVALNNQSILILGGSQMKPEAFSPKLVADGVVLDADTREVKSQVSD